MVAVLSRESLAAGWRIAGAKVDWRNAMASEFSSLDRRCPLMSAFPLRNQARLGPARGTGSSKEVLFCLLTMVKEAQFKLAAVGRGLDNVGAG